MKTPDEIKKGLECCKLHDGYDDADCSQCPYTRTTGKCVFVMHDDALAYIQQLEAKVPRWISVEERLPEYGRYLVVTRKGEGMFKVQTATYNNMGWWMHANFGEITHWMPLPELPEVR